MRRTFPQRVYRRRALIESLFSSVKRKLSARAPGRSLPMQMRQALLLGLSFNLYRLKHRCLFLRMSTELNRLRCAISLLFLGSCVLLESGLTRCLGIIGPKRTPAAPVWLLLGAPMLELTGQVAVRRLFGMSPNADFSIVADH
jgi:hypothetical protein